LNANTRVALFVVLATILWLGSGLLSEEFGDVAEPTSAPLIKVQVEKFSERDFAPQLWLRSHTEPFRIVDLKAQVAGRIVAVPGRRGYLVERGQVICAIDKEDRQQRVDQSVAHLQQAEIAYRGALQLKTAGYQSELAIAQAKANMEAAKLALKRSEIDLDNLNIKAPFSAIVEDRPVEVGDFLASGQLCARLVELHPLKLIAQAAETDVARLKLGQKALATFDNYPDIEVSLTYIAHEANPKTRSYPVEAKAKNSDLLLRAGISGRLNITLPSIKAHLIPASLILLDSDGDITVRAVDAENRVIQIKVAIVGEDKKGVWVQGLPKAITLITVGQNYVSRGEHIEIYLSSNVQ